MTNGRASASISLVEALPQREERIKMWAIAILLLRKAQLRAQYSREVGHYSEPPFGYPFKKGKK